MKTLKTFLGEGAGIADARFTKILRHHEKDIESLLINNKLSTKLYKAISKYYVELKEMPKKIQSGNNKNKITWVTKQLTSDLS
jgi:hypothetical protein